jgi:hypothetical protein
MAIAHLCANCTHWRLDNPVNRKFYNDKTFPYCPMLKRPAGPTDTCEKFMLSNFLLIHPELAEDERH